MMTMMASLVEWRSNSSLFFFCPSPSFYTFWFSFSWFPPPLPFFYPPLTFFLLFSYPQIPHTAAIQSAGTGNSFLHDDVRTSAFSFCFLLLDGCVLGTLHHITSPFWFFILRGCWDLPERYIYHIPYTHMDMRWNRIGIDIPTVCSGTSYHAILYLTVSLLSSSSFLVSFVILFAVLGAGLLQLGLYHYLCIIC